VLHLPDVALAGEGGAAAFRLLATHPPPHELRPTWAADAGAAPSVTSVPVTIRVRNCCSHAMSVCVEGGVSAAALVPAPQVTAGCWMSAAPGTSHRLPLTPPLATLGACRRHQWAGTTRVHIAQLAPQQEAACEMLVLLHGAGAFVVDDYACTWSIPELSVFGSSTPGEPLAISLPPPEPA